MREKLIPLIIGILLAAVSSYMISVYMNQQKKMFVKEAQETVYAIQQNQVSALVARGDIPTGATVDASMLESAILSKQQIAPNAVRYFNELENKVTTRPIRMGEQLTTDMFRSTDVVEAQTQVSLSMLIPEGKRATSIAVDNISSIVGMLKPGDHVDVLGIINLIPQGKNAPEPMSIPLFQDVLILAIGEDYWLGEVKSESLMKKLFGLTKELEKKSKTDTRNPLVTLALDPEETSVISYVQEHGKLRLVLRSPSDKTKQTTAPITMENFNKFLMARGIIPVPVAPEEPPVPVVENAPALPTEEPKVEEPVIPKETVEIYRGMQKEVIEINR